MKVYATGHTLLGVIRYLENEGVKEITRILRDPRDDTVIIEHAEAC